MRTFQGLGTLRSGPAPAQLLQGVASESGTHDTGPALRTHSPRLPQRTVVLPQMSDAATSHPLSFSFRPACTSQARVEPDASAALTSGTWTTSWLLMPPVPQLSVQKGQQQHGAATQVHILLRDTHGKGTSLPASDFCALISSPLDSPPGFWFCGGDLYGKL